MDTQRLREEVRGMLFGRNVTLQSGWMSHWRKLPLVRSLVNRLTNAAIPASSEYVTWQQRFLQDRLGLSLWLSLVILLTFIARDFYNLAFPLRELQNLPEEFKGLWVAIDSLLTGLLIACLVLHRTPVGKRYPGILFLGLSWSITIAPQLLATARGFPLPDLLAWTLVFLLQATLIPVRWELHFISQTGLLFYFYGINSLLGLTTVPAAMGQTEKPIFVLTIFMYLFWFCFVCDLAVYLYERLQRAEFESRRQAQLFLHAVSHDLRNPVTGTALVLKKLLKQPEATVAVPRSLLERMIESSDRQLNLINSLLDIHKSDIRGMVLHQEPLALRAIAESVSADLEPLLKENQATLIDQIPNTLPIVNVDQTQIWRVLSNLVANALYHNPPGTILTLTAECDDSNVCCNVTDNGVGMTTTEALRVFELYTRGGRSNGSVGLGLGLYICRQIILAHGGEIGVTSAPSKGSTFWFTLPIAKGNSGLEE